MHKTEMSKTSKLRVEMQQCIIHIQNMSANRISILVVLLCLCSISQCIFFDLIGSYLSLFSSFYGVGSKYGKTTSNMWRDSQQQGTSNPWGGAQQSVSANIWGGNSKQGASQGVDLSQVDPSFSNNLRSSASSLASPFLTEVNTKNLVRDSQFNFNLGSDQFQFFQGRIGNWIVDKGQVGIGRIYNQNWGNTLVMELDSDQNQVYKYILNLSGGLYQISFDWAARQGQPLQTSQFILRFNGQDVADVAAPDYNIHHFSQIVRALPQNNELRLFGSGRSDSYGITVANFAVVKKIQNDGAPGFLSNPSDLPITFIDGNVFSQINNNLVNGDFQASRIGPGLSVTTSNIPSWVIKSGQIGLGQHYNINWAPKTQLIHLDSGRNLNYLNRVSLSRGKYEVSFDWAARDGKRLDTSQVIVKFNDKLLNTLTPKDYFCHRHSVVVDGIDGFNKLQLIGAGDADRFGASIDNVIVAPFRPRK